MRDFDIVPSRAGLNRPENISPPMTHAITIPLRIGDDVLPELVLYVGASAFGRSPTAADVKRVARHVFKAIECARWKPIDDSVKEIVSRRNGDEFGRYVLAYPVHGEVARVHWWQAPSAGPQYANFLTDGGNAVHPVIYAELPSPPED